MDMYLWNQFLLRITGYAKLDSKVPSGRPQGTLFHTLKYNFIGPSREQTHNFVLVLSFKGLTRPKKD